MNHIDTMKQALEVVKQGSVDHLSHLQREKLAAALILAIEQMEKQEPVAWMSKTGHGTYWREHITQTLREMEFGGRPIWTPLYTAPPQRQPLSQQEIDEIIMQHTGGFIGGMHFVRLARAIEAAHGIKGGS